MSATFRVSYQKEIVKSVHLLGFIIKKFVTMHGHMDVKFDDMFQQLPFPTK